MLTFHACHYPINIFCTLEIPLGCRISFVPGVIYSGQTANHTNLFFIYDTIEKLAYFYDMRTDCSIESIKEKIRDLQEVINEIFLGSNPEYGFIDIQVISEKYETGEIYNLIVRIPDSVVLK